MGYMFKKTLKRIALISVEQQVKVLILALSTIFLQKFVHFLVGRFPKFKILKQVEERTARV